MRCLRSKCLGLTGVRLWSALRVKEVRRKKRSCRLLKQQSRSRMGLVRLASRSRCCKKTGFRKTADVIDNARLLSAVTDPLFDADICFPTNWGYQRGRLRSVRPCRFSAVHPCQPTKTIGTSIHKRMMLARIDLVVCGDRAVVDRRINQWA